MIRYVALSVVLLAGCSSAQYAAPAASYGAPAASSGYAAPDAGYGAPTGAASYAAPSTGYDAAYVERWTGSLGLVTLWHECKA